MIRKLLVAIAILIVLLLAAAVIAVNVIDPNDYRDEISSRASAQLGREVALNGPLALKLFPWLALEIADVAVGNPAGFGEAPPLARIGTARVAVRLLPLFRGAVETGTITLDDADFALVTNRRGASNLEGLMQPAAEPAPATDLGTLSLGAIRLRDVNLIVVDQTAKSRQEVHIARFDFDPFRAGRAVDFELSGSVSSDGAPLIEALHAVGDLNVAADLSAVEFGSLDLELGHGGQTVGLTLDEPLKLQLAEPVSAALPAAHLTIAGQRLDLAGQLKLAAAPSADLQIRGQRLDLAALAPPAPAAETAAQEPAAGAQAAAADFSALKPWTASLDVEIGEVVLPPTLSLGDLVAKARLQRGVLVLKPLAAKLYGGRFDGEASVDLNRDPPAVRIAPRLAGIQAGELLGAFGGPAPVRGTGDMALDLTFSGLDTAAMMKTMNGQGTYHLTDGALLGVDLNRLIDEKLTVENAANVSQAFGGETPFEVLEGTVEAQNGVLKTPGLTLDAGAFDIAGGGAVDLAGESLDYSLDLNLGEGLQQKLPARLMTLTGGKIPLAIKGPIGAPLVTVDMAGIAQRAVKQQGKKLKENVLGRLGVEGAPQEEGTESGEDGAASQPKDVLKSLFGRKKEPAEEKDDDGGL